MKKIKSISKTAETIMIVGAGYVGLPLGLAFLNGECEVVLVDSNKEKIDKINRCFSPVDTVLDQDLTKFVEKKQLKAVHTDDKLLLEIMVASSNAIIICVPTPLSKNHEPDLSYIRSAINMIMQFNLTSKIIVLESTTFPTTTQKLIIGPLKKLGYSVGENIFVGYSPEREDPGNTQFKTSNIPKLFAGSTGVCSSKIKNLYEKAITLLIEVSNIETAEMAKLLENTYRAVNIGLVNELKVLAHKLDINIFEVIKAASTKPFGYQAFYPGPGVGGHCIPVDPLYLSWIGKEYGLQLGFIEHASYVNHGMKEYIISRIFFALNKNKKAISGSKIAVLGATYKRNISDQRESPSLQVINDIIIMGGNVVVFDKYLKGNQSFQISQNCEVIDKFDLVILLTDHDYFDYEKIQKGDWLIVDCRGRFENNENVIQA